MSSQSRMSSRSLVSFRERDRDQTFKHSRSKRAGSTKDEDVDKVCFFSDVSNQICF